MPSISKIISDSDTSPTPESSEQKGEENLELTEVFQREERRLFARRDILQEQLQGLLEHFPSASCFVPEMEAFRKNQDDFLARIRGVDWDQEVKVASASIEKIWEELEDKSEILLQWSDASRSFAVEDKPTWKRREEAKEVSLADFEERQVEQAEAAVSYPIIFTHEVEGNQQAIARALGWAVVLKAAALLVEKIDELSQIVLSSSDATGGKRGDIIVAAGGVRFLQLAPSALDFGFTEEGEFLRRLSDFSQTDRDAHWKKWMEQRGEAPEEIRVLREQSGKQIKVVLDRELLRLREVSYPASVVVRKRHTVFVEPAAPVDEDWYFAPEKNLGEALEDYMRRRIDEGFRVVYEGLRREGALEERGKTTLD